MAGKRGSEFQEYARLKREKKALLEREKALRDKIAMAYGRAVMDAGGEELDVQQIGVIVAAVSRLGFDESCRLLDVKARRKSAVETDAAKAAE